MQPPPCFSSPAPGTTCALCGVRDECWQEHADQRGDRAQFLPLPQEPEEGPRRHGARFVGEDGDPFERRRQA